VKILTIIKIEVLFLQEKKMSKKEEFKTRKIIKYKHYFDEFYNNLDRKTQAKIVHIFSIIIEEKQVDKKFLKHLTGIKDLYEIRVAWQRNIYRIFCCLDKGNLVILFNGFTKKTDKTPQNQIDKAVRLMNEYFKEKENGNKNKKQ